MGQFTGWSADVKAIQEAVKSGADSPVPVATAPPKTATPSVAESARSKPAATTQPAAQSFDNPSSQFYQAPGTGTQTPVSPYTKAEAPANVSANGSASANASGGQSKAPAQPTAQSFDNPSSQFYQAPGTGTQTPVNPYTKAEAPANVSANGNASANVSGGQSKAPAQPEAQSFDNPSSQFYQAPGTGTQTPIAPAAVKSNDNSDAYRQQLAANQARDAYLDEQAALLAAAAQQQGSSSNGAATASGTRTAGNPNPSSQFYSTDPLPAAGSKITEPGSPGSGTQNPYDYIEDGRYRPMDPGTPGITIAADGTILGYTAGDNGNGNVRYPGVNIPGGGNGAGGSSGGGSGSGGNGGASGAGAYGNGTSYSDATLLNQLVSAAGMVPEGTPYKLPDMPGANPERLEHVDISDLEGILQQIVDAQKQQSQNAIDYNVQTETDALNRAVEDAAAQFQTQRNQASADEMRSLDNQALYAEARGDRGGIGESQYASIQAAAAQNRRAVNDAQVKLSTDVARQISDLRAQGEFTKADQLLSITQSYLSNLMSLQQWALEANMGVDEFNSRLQQWVDEYNLNVQKYLTDLDLSAAQLTGVFADGTQTRAAQQQLISTLASSGSALLNAGVLPSRQQLEAMGMTEVQAQAFIQKLNAAAKK